MIVDLQRAFPVPPRLVERVERYSRRFKRRIFTRYENPRGSPFRRLLKQRCCAPDSPDTQLWITPAKGDLLMTKSGYGLESRHIAHLRRHRITRVTVCGVDTDACVLGVMFSLFDAGIDCRVKGNLCWSSSGLHQPAMRIIKEQFPRSKR